MTKYECGGGCGKRVIRPEGPLSFCTTHYYLEDALQSEDCPTVAELLRVRERVEYCRARITDLIRRSDVHDADTLISAVSRI